MNLGESMKPSFAWIGLLLAAVVFLSPLPGHAQAYEYAVYVDTDDDAATGCTVSTPSGDVIGVEVRLAADVEIAAPAVTGQRLAKCVDGAMVESQVIDGAYPVGFDLGPDSLDVIELGAPAEEFAPPGNTPWRLVFGAQSPLLGSSDLTGDVRVSGLGVPLMPRLIPAASLALLGALALAVLAIGTIVVRRNPHLLSIVAMVSALALSGIVWAATHVLDGQIGDWPATALITDPAGDTTQDEPQVDIRQAFAESGGNQVYFRIDVSEIRLAALLPSLLDTAFTIPENSPNGTGLGPVRPSSDGLLSILALTQNSQTPGVAFAFDPASTNLSVSNSALLDFETHPQFQIGLSATLAGLPGYALPVTVTVDLQDVNDAPSLAAQSFSVTEHSANGTVVGTVVASDPDAGPNGQLAFSVIGGSGQPVFAIDADSGEITVANAAVLDLADSPYTLNVAVSDLGAAPLSANATMTITVVDENDAPSPTLTPPSPITLAENTSIGTTVTTISPNDPDVGQSHAYAIVSGNTGNAFSVDASGTVQVNGVLDFEGPDAPYALVLRVTDNGLPPLSTDVALTIDLNDVNEAPVVVAGGTLAYTEGDGAVPADAGVAVADPDAGAMIQSALVQIVGNYASGEDVLGFADTATISGAFNAATGILSLSGSDTVANYQAALRSVTYANGSNAPSIAPRTIAWSVNDGALNSNVATSTVTLTSTNTPPVITSTLPGSATEDVAFTYVPTIDDPDGPGQHWSLASGHTCGGTVDPDSGQFVFTPAGPVPAADCVVALQVCDGGTPDECATQSGTVTITAVNDAPVITSTPPATATEAVPYAYQAIVDDPDGPGATWSLAPGNTCPGASIDAAGLYGFTPAGPTPPASCDVGVQVCDGGTPDECTDQVATIAITAVDDAPVAVDDTAVVDEDAGAAPIDVLANDTDADGGPMAIASVTQPANGTVAITGGGTGLTYQPNPDYCNDPPGTTPDTFTYALAPGGDTATVSVTVSCVDDAPVAVDDSTTITEDDPATAIDVLANDTDIDGGPMAIDAVTQPANGVVAITGGGTGLTYLPNPNYCNDPPGTAPDTFTYTLAPGGSTATVSVLVTCVVDDPVAVDDAISVNEDSGVTAIDVLDNDDNPDGSPIAIDAVTQPANGVVVITGGGTGLAYQPNPDYCNTPPGTTLDVFTYSIAPGGSVGTVRVAVACVDDPPVAVSDSATVIEDSGANAINVLANDTDIDGGPIAISSVTQPANGTVAITGGGTGLTYQPNPNFCTQPGTTDTFTYTLTPGGSSATVSMTVTCVNDPPVPPTVPVIPVHTHIAINVEDGATGDLLIPADIVDPDSSNFIIAPVPPLASLPTATVNGGELSINAGTGAFTYNPPAGFTGSDSFQFVVCDDGSPVACSGAVTVTLNVSGPKIWFVDDDAIVVGTPDGTLQQPLPSLVAAAASATSGDRIFVFGGNYNTGITLPNGVELVGHGIDAASTADFDVELGIAPPSHSISRPLVDQIPPVLTNTGGAAITLGINNTIRGVHLGNSSTAAIRGNNFGMLRVYDDVSVSTNGMALDLTNGTFTDGSVFTSVTSTGGARNLLFSGVGGSVDLGTGAMSGATGAAFSVVNDSTVQISYAGTISTTANDALIRIADKPSGAITLSGALSATNGTGIQLSNVDAGFTATGVVTLNGGDAAIDIIDGSAGTINFSNAASVITNPANEAVVISSSSPTFTFAGAIFKTNNAVTGIRIESNTSGSVFFPNPTLTLITQSANAVHLFNNGSMTVSFTGGNLTLNTTSGTAFHASGSGNVAVTGSANTAMATAGTALNIDGHAITAAGVTFRSLNSNGGNVGIRVANTGNAGGLTVTGTGTAGSGGTIQNAITSGIALASTRNVVLNRMNITGSGDDGINGASVTNFSCDFCVLTNNGNSAADEGMQFTNLAGTANITNSSFTNSAHNSIYVENTSGTLAALTISNNNFVSNSVVNGNHHVLIVGVTGSPVFSDIDVIGNTFANARSIGLQILGNNSSSMPDVAVNGNNFYNNTLAIDASLVDGSNLGFNISSNSINSTVSGGSHAINSNQGIPSTGMVRGRVQNTMIGTAGMAGSGSMIGNGVRIIGNGNGTKQYIVTNTTVRETRNGRGIEIINRNGGGRMDVTVTNNNVDTNAQASDFPLSAILLQSNCIGACNSLRADVADNVVTVPLAGCNFDIAPPYCLALVETGASTCELFDRPPTGAASVTSELIVNNPSSGTSAGASAGCELTNTAPVVP